MTPMLPLDTLPGWPEASAPSTGFMLALTVGLPLLTGLLFTLIGFAAKLGRDYRRQTVESGLATQAAIEQVHQEDALALAAEQRAGRINAVGRRNAIVS